MTECKKCGKKPEHNGHEVVETHHLGCLANRRKPQASEPDLRNAGPAPETCGRAGCEHPRAASKGPRPAKYCEEHKTKRSSK